MIDNAEQRHDNEKDGASRVEPINEDASEEKTNFWQVVLSVLAAGFGVQSSKNRERDFKHGSLKMFIFVGLIAVSLFIGTITTVVSLVLK